MFGELVALTGVGGGGGGERGERRRASCHCAHSGDTQHRLQGTATVQLLYIFSHNQGVFILENKFLRPRRKSTGQCHSGRKE